MIVDPAGTHAISNLRWLDHGNLWTYSLGDSESRAVHVSDAQWLSLVSGSGEYFAAVHQRESGTVRLTAHSYLNTAETVSSIELEIGDNKVRDATKLTVSFMGETSVWSFLPKAYIVHAFEDELLLLVDLSQRAGQTQPLHWYKGAYDTLYQGILGVAEVPGSPLVIVSIQRDSEPVLYDPVARKVVRKLKLTGRHGGPQLFFRRTAPELWASDYDTLLRLDLHSWNVLDVLKLQEPKGEMKRMNVGEYCFDIDEDFCVVARPYSGDVVGIDTKTFKIALRAETGGQPQEVGALRGGFVVARDLKTGQLLRSTLKRI